MKSPLKATVLILGDLVILNMALLVTLYIRYFSTIFPSQETIETVAALHVFPFLIVHGIWILVFFSAGLYDWRQLARTHRNLPAIVTRTVAVGAVLAAILFYLIPAFKIAPKTNLLFDAILVIVGLVIWRSIFINTVAQTQKTKVMFLGSSGEVKKLVAMLNATPSLGYDARLFTAAADQLPPQLTDYAKKEQIDLVVVEPSDLENKMLVKSCYEMVPLGITVTNFAAFYEAITGKIPTSLINESWFLENLFELDKRSFERLKRSLDILVAGALSIPVIIVLPLVALAIKLDSHGSIFYYQRRVGKNGKLFYFIKFRSMYTGSDTLDGAKNIEQDSRQTRVGKMLRALYLDELPQIVNVLRGEMSFVGPRPERPQYVEDLKKRVPFYEVRLLVNPGITGWAQINMDNDASVEDAPEKLQYDLYYIKHRSIFTDLAVMLKTATILVRRTGR
jgi:exopolysaccharide biosynthesis polyprenyl glycosylphosphotransferase